MWVGCGHDGISHAHATPSPAPLSNLELGRCMLRTGVLLKTTGDFYRSLLPFPPQTRSVTRPTWWVRKNPLDPARPAHTKLSRLSLARWLTRIPLDPGTRARCKCVWPACTFYARFELELGFSNCCFLVRVGLIFALVHTRDELSQRGGAELLP